MLKDLTGLKNLGLIHSVHDLDVITVPGLQGADVVFHFAANPEVRISSVRPRVHFDENVVATFNVLEAARRFDVEALVFASSSTVYGDPEVVPMPEDHPKRPVSIYGASKLACEVLVETYYRLYGLKALILRYAKIFKNLFEGGCIKPVRTVF